MRKNNKGFTLAELLIVVAIVAVLVAIAIPIFTNQLEKSREATDIANVRSAYANVMAKYLTDADNGYSMSVTAKQTIAGWQGDSGTLLTQIDGVEKTISFSAVTNGSQYLVKIENSGGTANVTVTAAS